MLDETRTQADAQRESRHAISPKGSGDVNAGRARNSPARSFAADQMVAGDQRDMDEWRSVLFTRRGTVLTKPREAVRRGQHASACCEARRVRSVRIQPGPYGVKWS